MGDEEKDKNLPWLYRVEPLGADRAQPDLDPASAVYRLFTNTRNPFLKRALAPPAPKLECSPAELQKLFRLLVEQHSYRVAPTNEEPPFRRRRLEHPTPPAPPQPHFQQAQELPADPARLPVLVDQFFRSVLERLRANPEAFFAVVDELVALARKNKVRFRQYESYHTLIDWDDLMRTLEEIARYPAAETFDLFCSALIAYRELV